VSRSRQTAARERIADVIIDLYQRVDRNATVKRVLRRIGVASHLTRAHKVLLAELLADTYSTSVAGIDVTYHSVSPGEAYMHSQVLKTELPIVRRVLDDLDPEDVFWDVGANVGMFTCLAAARLPGGRIHAFEPHPNNADRIEDNLSLNDRSATVHNVALGSDPGTAELSGRSGDVGEGTHSLGLRGGESTIEVDVQTGDGVVTDGAAAPTVMKIDVEGAELRVLRGLADTIDGGNPSLIHCEVHPKALERFGDTAEEVYGFLEDHGFEYVHLHDRGDQHFVRAVR